MKTLTEPFKIKMVEPLKVTTAEYRLEALKAAGYNTFQLHSSDVFIDLLTDSGTGAMSEDQWAGVMLGDESYAGSSSWEALDKEVHALTGMPHVFPTHQGRAAERILYGLLGGPGKVFVSNTHFDTTRANIEFTGATAIDLLPEDAKDPARELPFKGNIDLAQLEEAAVHHGNNLVAVIMTVTNNSAGGQPVSMENVREVRKICDKHGILLVLDGCRVAENSYFIRHREPGFEGRTYRSIAQEMFTLCDAFVMSAKKDGLANMGGLLCMRDANLAERCKNLLIISEGFTTYGGLSGRDMEALAIGLREVFDPDYLHYRIRSTAYLGEGLHKKGIPVVRPIGGHAVYVDAAQFYPHIPVDQYPGQALVCDLYEVAGIRCVEVGSVMFGKADANGKLIPADHELVRLAIPRRVYTQSHIDYVLEAFDELQGRRNQTTGYRIAFEPPFLRHFSARFEKL